MKTKTYTVNVCRIGYGHAELKVQATSKARAARKALDEAGGVSFSEHDADYKIDGIREGD